MGELTLDLDDHPSEVSAGTALVTTSGPERQVLVTRARTAGFELPKGGIEWDELPLEAALRELREESGVDGEFRIDRELGHLRYFVGSGPGRHLKQVTYFSARASDTPPLGPLPEERSSERGSASKTWTASRWSTRSCGRFSVRPWMERAWTEFERFLELGQYYG